MNVDRYLRMIAGAIVMATLALGYFVSPYWYLFTAFVGLNLFQSAFTNWCPMMTILRKIGIPDRAPGWRETTGAMPHPRP
ncbi:MAG TPA: DUF2892 domain-containing protein [Bryobacteraceae bacterium]|nr:DUF2892 domain-containing protein [Bryobacteraceae bacterium]